MAGASCGELVEVDETVTMVLLTNLLISGIAWTTKYTISAVLPSQQNIQLKSEFKEFEPRLKFKPRLKYGWFHLKLYLIFQDLGRRSIETGF